MSPAGTLMPRDSNRQCLQLSAKFCWDRKRLTEASALRICCCGQCQERYRRMGRETRQQMRSLATSYGLTQVMGYEAIAFHTHGVEALRQPLSSLVITSRLLAQFASRFGLDLAKDFAELFDCWNTGRPHAPTADPQYVPRGLARLQLYQNILASMGSAT